MRRAGQRHSFQQREACSLEEDNKKGQEEALGVKQMREKQGYRTSCFLADEFSQRVSKKYESVCRTG